MAPNPVSEDSQSGDSKTQLEYIEETLRKIQQSTLKMKRRNDAVIKSIDRRNTVSIETSETTSFKLDSDISYSNPSLLRLRPPEKPPRNPKPSLTQDVEKILEETSEIKKKMQDTLRECARTRENNARQLKEMQNENRVLSIGTATGASNIGTCRSATLALASNSLSNSMFAGLKGVLRKLSHSSHAQENISSQRKNELDVVTEGPQGSISDPVVPPPPPKEATTSLSSQSQFSKPPIPKPRRRNQNQNQLQELLPENTESHQPRKINRPIAPPPAPPNPVKENVTFDELKSMYQDAPMTDDECTFSRPLPKPRTNINSYVEDERDEKISEEENEETSSESEFEYVDKPLVVETIPMSDADETLSLAEDDSNSAVTKTKPTSKSKSTGYSKNNSNRVAQNIPRHYRKSLKTDETEVQAQLQIPKSSPHAFSKKIKNRPSSPPPSPHVLISVNPTRLSKLENLSEEEALEELTVALPIEKSYLCVPIDDNRNTVPPLLPKPSNVFDLIGTKRTSALISGVPIEEINIQVKPFRQCETTSQKTILGLKRNFEDLEVEQLQNGELEFKSQQEQSYPAFQIQEANAINQEILETFSFLDDLEYDNEKGDGIENENCCEKISSSRYQNIVTSCSETEFTVEDLNERIFFEGKPIIHTIEHQKCSPATIPPSIAPSLLQNILPITQEIIPVAGKIPELSEKPSILPRIPTQVCTTMTLTIAETSLQNSEMTSESTSWDFKPARLILETEETINNPPPPPPPPMMPLLVSSDTFSMRKHQNLPVTPLEESLFESSIFSQLETIDESSFKLDTTFIEDNLLKANKSPKSNRRLSCIDLQTMNKDRPDSNTTLISANWKKQVEIGTKQIPKNSRSTLLTAIRTLNTDIITRDNIDIQILIQILPKDETMLKEMNQMQPLTDEFGFIKNLSDIPRHRIKLSVMNNILGFNETLGTLKHTITILKTAMDSIMESKNFPIILKIVLAMINKTFVKDDAPMRGFQLKSLQRLATAKSSDGKLSIWLICIVRTVKENCPDALKFFDEFKNLEEASRISFDEVNKIFTEIGQELIQCHEEINLTATDTTNNVDMNNDNLESLSMAKAKVNDAQQELEHIKESWEIETVKKLQKVAQYFGSGKKEDPIHFLEVIRNFVAEYKSALQEVEKLFRQNEEQIKQTNNSLARTPNVISPTKVQHCQRGLRKRNPSTSRNRWSLGGLPPFVDENFGQDLEMIRIMTNDIVNTNGREIRQRRRTRVSQDHPNSTTNCTTDSRER